MPREERKTEKPTRLTFKAVFEILDLSPATVSLYVYWGQRRKKRNSGFLLFKHTYMYSRETEISKYDFWLSPKKSDHFWNPKRVKFNKQGW